MVNDLSKFDFEFQKREFLSMPSFAAYNISSLKLFTKLRCILDFRRSRNQRQGSEFFIGKWTSCGGFPRGPEKTVENAFKPDHIQVQVGR